MSVVLYTAANFTVVRQIANHLDTATYYVKAVIRNAYTDEILTTLLLEDKGGQRFKKDWKVPSDPTGEGFYVSIVTSVYSDSDYTTKSENYGDEENTYLIQDRMFGGRSGGASGGSGPDSGTIRRIFQEEIEKAKPEEIKAPKVPKIDFSEVLGAIRGLEKSLKPEKQEKLDITPLISALGEVIRLVQEKEVTPETDLSPVLSLIQEMASQSAESQRKLFAYLGTMEGELANALTSEFERVVSGTTFKIGPSTATMDVPKEKPKAPIEEIDLNSFAA